MIGPGRTGFNVSLLEYNCSPPSTYRPIDVGRCEYDVNIPVSLTYTRPLPMYNLTCCKLASDCSSRNHAVTVRQCRHCRLANTLVNQVTLSGKPNQCAIAKLPANCSATQPIPTVCGIFNIFLCCFSWLRFRDSLPFRWPSLPYIVAIKEVAVSPEKEYAIWLARAYDQAVTLKLVNGGRR